jgi:O-antigen/teichoic acid export membrane protein
MSIASTNDSTLGGAASESAAPLRADSLAMGVTVLFSLAILQRVVGLVRGILFCRLLPEEELGTWSLAFSFLLLAAPLAVLGLPGSFGRYVERYRQRGQLGAFLRRTTLATAILAALGVAAICLAREPVSWLVFNDTSHGELLLLMGLALLAVIAGNFVVDLLTALRQVRAVSLVQFAHSMVFAVVGLGLLYFTGLGAAAVVIAYAAGSLAGIVVVLPALTSVWRAAGDQGSAGDNRTATPLPHGELWGKLLPFAAWIWLVNLLTNLFEMADRAMIVHFAPGTPEHVHALVGQYHSSRVLPALLITAASMLATVVLPYLSHDWEAGRKADVDRRHGGVLKLTGLAVFAGGAATLVCAPLLFGWVLAGRYNDGLAVLPWTLAYSCWFGMSLVAQNYLWCAERARLANVALLAGLAVNIVLNLALLPLLGLMGAVLATAAANALALTLVYCFSRAAGMPLDRGTLIVSLLPLLLGFGLWPALIGLVLAGWMALRTEWLFTSPQRAEVRRLWDQTVLRRLKTV